MYVFLLYRILIRVVDIVVKTVSKERMRKLCYLLQNTRAVKKPKVNKIVREIQQEIKLSKSEKPKLFGVFKLSAASFNKAC